MGYIFKRSWQAIIVVIGVITITFLLLQASGDPTTVMLSPEATKSDIEELRKAMGFDKPIFVQYLLYMKRTLKGDFGDSYMLRKSAFSLVVERLPATLELAIGGTVFALIVAIPLGIVAAIKRYTIFDNFSMVLAVSGQAVPLFWLALMLIILFGVKLGWLPPSGRGSFFHLIMPSVTLGVYMAPITMRLVRSGMIDVFEKDYIRTARAKGLPEKTVILKHAFKNVMIPVSTVLAMQFGRMIGGAVVTETVFAWPGVGRLAVTAIMDVDFPVVQASVFVMAIVIVSVNLFADVFITFIDPRIAYD